MISCNYDITSDAGTLLELGVGDQDEPKYIIN